MTQFEVLANRTFGLDKSKYQVYWHGPTDEAQYRVDFVIQRLSYGGRQDERLPELYTQLLEHGPKARGAYHYGSTGVDWKLQCDRFLRLYLDRDYHMAWWDFEEAFNNLNATYVEETFRAMDYIQDDLRSRGRPDPVGLYTNQANFIMWFADQIERIRAYPLWFSQYWGNYSPLKNPGLHRTKLSIEDVDIYQYSADAVQKRTIWKPYEDHQGYRYGFGSKFLDLNVFLHGQREVFAANFLGRPGLYDDQGSPITPDPPTDPTWEYKPPGAMRASVRIEGDTMPDETYSGILTREKE
jgi:hypothetical protein